MKREIIPGRFILLILAAFLAIMVLPIVLASLSGQLDLPVEQSYAPDAQELTITPKADWTIASVLPQEDGLLAPEMTGEGVTVPLAGLPAGEAETLQLGDVGAEGLLGDVQPLRRPGKAPLPGHHDKVVHAGKIHPGPPSSFAAVLRFPPGPLRTPECFPQNRLRMWNPPLPDAP